MVRRKHCQQHVAMARHGDTGPRAYCSFSGRFTLGQLKPWLDCTGGGIEASATFLQKSNKARSGRRCSQVHDGCKAAFVLVDLERHGLPVANPPPKHTSDMTAPVMGCVAVTQLREEKTATMQGPISASEICLDE